MEAYGVRVSAFAIKDIVLLRRHPRDPQPGGDGGEAGGSGCGAWLDFLDKGRFKLIARHFEIVVRLHIHPHFSRRSKVTSQAQGSFSGNAPRAADDRSDAIGRDVKRLRELIHGKAKIAHEFFQMFSRMNRGQFFRHGCSSVVVHDFNIVSVSFSLMKADAVLIVDPNAMLSDPVSYQGFEPVTRPVQEI